MNPFSFGAIVRGDSFFDRKEETKLLVDTLSGSNNVVLYAPRRYGKTSLVFRAMELLEEQGIPCLYIDLMSAFSLERFAELIVEAVRKKQSKLEVKQPSSGGGRDRMGATSILMVAIAKRRTQPPAVVMAPISAIRPIRPWRKASVREFYSRDRAKVMSTTVNTAVILKNQNPKNP